MSFVSKPRIAIFALLAPTILTVPAYLRAYTLSGISDAPTLLLGDTAVVNRAAYWIMVPCSRIRIKNLPREDFSWVPESHQMGSSVRNEDGHWIAFTQGSGQWQDMAVIRLKPDKYFSLGDNRDVSLDCRAWGR